MRLGYVGAASQRSNDQPIDDQPCFSHDSSGYEHQQDDQSGSSEGQVVVRDTVRSRAVRAIVPWREELIAVVRGVPAVQRPNVIIGPENASAPESCALTEMMRPPQKGG